MVEKDFKAVYFYLRFVPQQQLWFLLGVSLSNGPFFLDSYKNESSFYIGEDLIELNAENFPSLSFANSFFTDATDKGCLSVTIEDDFRALVVAPVDCRDQYYKTIFAIIELL